MTARTAEASTVPQPLGKPGGPGLWRQRGWQIPPYIQHVRDELIKQGKTESAATGEAVGIVTNWSHGHDGRGHAVHPDVQAAAAKNIAKWEAMRAVLAAKRGSRASEHTADPDYAALELAAMTELAFPADRPRGARVRLGSQPAERDATLRRNSTPFQAAAFVASLDASQRAQVRRSMLAPIGYQWSPGDRLTPAQD